MAKKKKPVVNPARGFATQSIASKPKPQKDEDAPKDSHDATRKATPTEATESPDLGASTRPNNAATKSNDATKELHELSPEALEKRLEQAELESLVEKYSGRSQRDSSRLASKLQTECRLLRGQAQNISLRQHLPDELILQIIELAKDELSKVRRSSNDRESRNAIFVPEDDKICRVWTLKRTLASLGFSESRVTDAVDYLFENPKRILYHMQGPVWAFEDALDWLALTSSEDDLPVYDTLTGLPKDPASNEPAIGECL